MLSRLQKTCLLLVLCTSYTTPSSADIQEVLGRRVLRHLGVPHARFVTDRGEGFDVELMRCFARHLGVDYRFVETSWDKIIPDLTGQKASVEGPDVPAGGAELIRGDIAASGISILPASQELIRFSTPVFPTQIWLVARRDSPVHPIKPSGNVDEDIAAVKSLLAGRSILGKPGTGLDPTLYGLQSTGARMTHFSGPHSEMAPALVLGKAEMMILDVPDALIALDKWPEKLKVIGPVSPRQVTKCAFARDSSALLSAFNGFMEECRRDGTLYRLAHKYYPSASHYFPDFSWFPKTLSRFVPGGFACLPIRS